MEYFLRENLPVIFFIVLQIEYFLFVILVSKHQGILEAMFDVFIATLKTMKRKSEE